MEGEDVEDVNNAQCDFRIRNIEELIQCFPQEFRHEIVKFTPQTSSQDDADTSTSESVAFDGRFVADIRCDVSASDWEYWLEYFSKASKTEWNIRHVHRSVSANAHTELSRSYVCHHNSKTKNLLSPKHFHKATGCTARLSVQVQKPTGRKLNDPKCRMYFEGGLVTLIIIQFLHNHEIGTRDHIRFVRPTDDVRMQFESYFSEYGMSVAEAKRYHTELLESHGCSVEDTNNPAINPMYRTITHWYTSWKTGTHRAHINRALKREREETKRVLVGLEGFELAVSDVKPLRQARSFRGRRRKDLTGDFSDEDRKPKPSTSSTVNIVGGGDALLHVDFEQQAEHEKAVPNTSSPPPVFDLEQQHDYSVSTVEYSRLNDGVEIGHPQESFVHPAADDTPVFANGPTLTENTQELINDVQVLLYEKLTAFGSDWCTLALRKLKFRLNSVSSSEQMLDLLNIMASKVIQRRPRRVRSPPLSSPVDGRPSPKRSRLHHTQPEPWHGPAI